MSIKEKYITLCGSSRFKHQFERTNSLLSLQGKVVYSLAIFGHSDNVTLSEKEKEILDQVHFDKIKNSEAIYIINVDGYIGESTRKEIEYSKSINKKIYYLEN